jgi:hypothetical protein
VEVEVSTGLRESEKGAAEWNGVRTHHVDAHALDNGTWVAAIDGDNMFSVQTVLSEPGLAHTQTLSGQ